MKNTSKNDAVFRERFKQLRIALKISAKETKRRLKVLNGEGKRINRILKESVPREVFDRTMNSINERNEKATQNANEKNDRVLEIIRKDIKDLADYKTAQEGKSKLTQFIPWVIAAATLAYSIFKK